MDRDELVEILNYHFLRELEATMIYVRNSFIMEPCDRVEQPRQFQWMRCATCGGWQSHCKYRRKAHYGA